MSAGHVPVLLPLTFFLGALLIALGARTRPPVAYLVAVASGAVALALSVTGLFAVLDQGDLHYKLGGWQPPIGIELVLDPLSAFVVLVVNSVALAALIHSRRVVPAELPGKSASFYGVALLLLGGLVGIVVTGDLFNLYVFLEISSLATYALVAVGGKQAPVSAFRYLILGTIGASFYLLGLGFVLLATGSLNMADVAKILPHAAPSPAITVGLILMVMGIALKMGLFPMHGWMPDAYTYASSSATALIAPIGTKVAAYVLIRLLLEIFTANELAFRVPLLKAVGYLGAIGIVWGSVMAIAQRDLKRMLAYSSVGQLGYIALGIGLASTYGWIGAVLHILNHACMKGCLFLATCNFFQRLGHTDTTRLESSVRVAMPWTAASFSLAAFSMIGLPPTAGFFSKWYLALGSVEKSNWVFLAAILLSSLLNAVYFFRVLERIYLRPGKTPERQETRSAEAAPSMLVPTMVLAAAVLVLGIANALIVNHVIEPMIPPLVLQ